jgi:hypothetical protein
VQDGGHLTDSVHTKFINILIETFVIRRLFSDLTAHKTATDGALSLSAAEKLTSAAPTDNVRSMIFANHTAAWYSYRYAPLTGRASWRLRV